MKLSLLLCWVIFDKINALLPDISAGEAIFSYENCPKSGPSGKKLSNNGHLATKFKVHFSAQNYLIMGLFNNGQHKSEYLAAFDFNV